MDDPTAAPATPPPGTVPGPKSCLIAVGIASLLGFGSIVAAKLMIEQKNEAVLDAAAQLDAILAEASEAPGAAALREVGCEASGVIAPAALIRLAAPLAEENARKKGEPPRPIDIRADDPVVYCATRAEEAPACEALA